MYSETISLALPFMVLIVEEYRQVIRENYPQSGFSRYFLMPSFTLSIWGKNTMEEMYLFQGTVSGEMWQFVPLVVIVHFDPSVTWCLINFSSIEYFLLYLKSNLGEIIWDYISYFSLHVYPLIFLSSLMINSTLIG